MGFKKVSTNLTVNEENFINQARGETLEVKKPKNLKRDKSFLLWSCKNRSRKNWHGRKSIHSL